MWIVAINGVEPITSQVALDELNLRQTPCVKSKINISLCRRKRYHKTDIEDIHSRFDKVRPAVSYLEVFLPKKPPAPRNIGESLKVSQRKSCK